MLSIQQLENGDKDLNHVADFATSSELSIVDRTGKLKPSLLGVITELKSFNLRGEWVALTQYKLKDVVFYNGFAYVSIMEHVSGTSFLPNSSKWAIYQGVTKAELAVTTGAALIGFDELVAASEKSVSGALSSLIQVNSNKVYDDFSMKPNGDLGPAMSGQKYLIYPPSGLAKPIIKNGKMTFNHPGSAGGYASVKMRDPIDNMGCRFVLGPYSTPNGVVALIPWANDVGASYDAGAGIPATPMHLVVGATSWGVGYFSGNGSPDVLIASGSFSPALIADGTTIHTVEAWLDYAKGQIILNLPDGRCMKIPHPAMHIKGYFACVEPYRFNAGSTDSLPEFVSWWAESSGGRSIANGESKYLAFIQEERQKDNHKIYSTQVMANTDLSFTTGSSAKINGAFVDFKIPKSRRVLVTLNCFVDIKSDGLFFIQFHNGNNEMLTNISAGTKAAHGGSVCISAVLENLAGSIGSDYRIQASVFSSGGEIILKLHSGGPDAFIAVVTVNSL